MDKKLGWHWDPSRKCFFEGALADQRWCLPENIVAVIEKEEISALTTQCLSLQAKLREARAENERLRKKIELCGGYCTFALEAPAQPTEEKRKEDRP